MSFFSRTNYRSFYLLNATQFLGAMNDNIFKLLVIYLLINVQGSLYANKILALAGAAFVIPFLLFSSAAGVLADRKSKRTIIVLTKLLEVVVMGLSIVAVFLQSSLACYTLLFLMATQSAIFGPSKYGIIPELVEQKKISRANGLLSSFTYLAIIIGTFLASFITDITNKNFILMASFCLFIAIMGFFTSLGIAKTNPKKAKKKINPVFFYEIYKTLCLSRETPHLLMAIIGSAFFLLVGSFTQLNIIPFAIESLGLSEVGGGYLFLFVAIGIAIGSIIAGKLGKEHVDLGLSCVASLFIAILFFLLWIFSFSLVMTVLILIFLGVFGGLLLVPFDSFIQIKSPDQKRGQVIASSNFLSFCGVLISAFLIYLFGDELAFSAASGFGLMGLITLVFNLVLIGSMTEIFLPYLSKHFILKKYRLRLDGGIPAPDSLLILQKRKMLQILMLYSLMPETRVLVSDKYFRTFPWINGFLNTFYIVTPDRNPEKTLHVLFKKAKELQDKEKMVCIILRKHYPKEMIENTYKHIFGKFTSRVLFANLKKEPRKKTFISRIFHKRSLTLSFTREETKD